MKKALESVQISDSNTNIINKRFGIEDCERITLIDNALEGVEVENENGIFFFPINKVIRVKYA